MKCCICRKKIDKQYREDGTMYWDKGHNAEPVVAKGRCCSQCNAKVVIPMRIAGLKPGKVTSL